MARMRLQRAFWNKLHALQCYELARSPHKFVTELTVTLESVSRVPSVEVGGGVFCSS